MAWKDFIKKKVYIQVDTSKGLWTYSGICDDVVYMGKNTDKTEVYFIEITQTDGKKAGFVSNSIKLIKEEK